MLETCGLNFSTGPEVYQLALRKEMVGRLLTFLLGW